ncbi:hypothetical protein [Desulfospira joergensenii]|uniref:hypothetical protein n=1 Tax=Desulfospira joergensenii TaxID=53329 RepID=UPI0003B5996E|nr:hypothetical protein [Desulfospira joergensenii]
MNDPMTNFELGKIQHKEHEAWTGRHRKKAVYWKPARPRYRAYKIILSIIGMGAAVSCLLELLF